jgi:hypothetical protein
LRAEDQLTPHTYDAANRLTAVDAQSIAFNNTGQMTDDGTLTYSWDRGGRLLSAGSSSYAYNGLGNRLSQTVSAVVTDYLLDLQPGLSKVLVATTGATHNKNVRLMYSKFARILVFLQYPFNPAPKQLPISRFYCKAPCDVARP